MTMLLRIAALAAFIVSMATGNAHAQYTGPLGNPTDAKAKELLEKGNRHYRVKEIEKAIELYKQGALVEDAPVFLYNLGQCYRMLGQYEDAIWHYERFLDRRNPTGEVRTYVEEFITDMKAELEQRAKSKEPTEPGPDTPPAEPDEPEPKPGDEMPMPVPADAPPAWHADTLGWILTATGAVATIGGGLLLANASGLESDANAEPNETDRMDLRDTASSRRTMGIVATVAGAGLLVAGIVKLAIAPKRADGDGGLALSVGASWIGVTGSF